ncbi:hypothetical protein EI77_01144 [Prosthecobacter fusiformis]|uniref:PilZ domain-containing protein n=1 Tax=Prosthecobacter fusiformis TaxID=48464 RepID=A0A4R7SS53_9BACT|nr:hypothetical protein [Prosthecobacter fusiformis]TDU81834.1 hypothetical protein EI77_01144 [Prosthecobacter fusiformis]
MANHGQHQQGNSASKRSGAGQAVVELCAVSECGLVFWSRQRFDIGAELQIRVRRDAIPGLKICQTDAEEWISLRGFVVECPAMRRPCGEHGFQVSLLMESALTAVTETRQTKPKHACPKMKSLFPGLQRAGLN